MQSAEADEEKGRPRGAGEGRPGSEGSRPARGEEPRTTECWKGRPERTGARSLRLSAAPPAISMARKQNGPRISCETAGRLRTGYPEPGDSLPLFFFLPPPRGLIVRGRAVKSSGFHPQAAWPDRKVHQYERCESDRVADRPFALHTEALDRCGRDTRLVPSIRAGVFTRIDGTPEPLVRRRPPRNFRSNSPRRAWSRQRVPTLPLPSATAI